MLGGFAQPPDVGERTVGEALQDHALAACHLIDLVEAEHQHLAVVADEDAARASLVDLADRFVGLGDGIHEAPEVVVEDGVEVLLADPSEVEALREDDDIPGKAVIELEIENPSFQDFRQDASCIIRPASLLGEKYVDCQPTQAHAPGTTPPPPLKVIPSGQAGAGEHALAF